MSEQKSKTGLLLAILLVLLIIGVIGWQSGLFDSSPSYDATVTGTVSIEGVLAKEGKVSFFPAGGGLPSAGMIKSDGTYSMRTGKDKPAEPDGPTMTSGEYIVTVFINAAPQQSAEGNDGAPPRPGPSLIAAKYGSKDLSDLKYTVKPGPNSIVLDLEGPEQDPGNEVDTAGDEEKLEEAADN